MRAELERRRFPGDPKAQRGMVVTLAESRKTKKSAVPFVKNPPPIPKGLVIRNRDEYFMALTPYTI